MESKVVHDAKAIANLQCSAALALALGAMPLPPQRALVGKALVVTTECGSFFWPLTPGADDKK